MTSSAHDQLARVLDSTGQLAASVRDDQWTAPTPCPEWNVRDLLAHVVGGNRIFARLLHGEAPPDWTAAPRGTLPELLGDDPVVAYRVAADELLDAFGTPGAMERQLRLPIGTVPGSVALELRITEVLVHGWDLARATGQATAFPVAIVERSLDYSRRRLADLPPGRRPFAPPQPVPDGAPPIDRLAALLGRPVTPDPTT